jgi:hypothetical protein
VALEISTPGPLSRGRTVPHLKCSFLPLEIGNEMTRE